MNAGDTVALCRGGSWTFSSLTISKRCSSDPGTCDIRDYGSGALPVLNFNSGSFNLDGASFVRVWNLDIENSANVDFFQALNDARNLDICGSTINGGHAVMNFQPTGTDNLNIRVRNNTISNGTFAGFYGGGPDVQVTGNVFSNNGTGASVGAEHTVYWIAHLPSGSQPAAPWDGAPGTHPPVLSNNQISTGSYCQGVMVVVHGEFENSGLVIENNNITTTSTNGNCEGIQISGGLSGADFHGLHIRRNRVAPGSYAQAIEMNCCVNCSVEDNIAYNSIAVAWATSCTDGASSTGNVVVNNSIYIPATSWAQAIWTNGAGHTVANNAIWTTGSCLSVNGASVNTSNYCASSATAIWNNPSAGDFTPVKTGSLIGAANATYASPNAIGSPTWSPSDAGVARTAPFNIGAF
jgi:hypothetical protein